MSDKWFVSRQHHSDAESDTNVVEITKGSSDSTGLDRLPFKYKDEGKAYDSMPKAIAAALQVATAWEQEEPDLDIHVELVLPMTEECPLEPIAPSDAERPKDEH